MAKDSGRGTPQGAPISPLLSNLYMRRFVLGWKQLGWEEKLQARVVAYADDFVILCRRNAAEARKQMQAIMTKLKLTVNEQKTRTCRVPEESFDFPGIHPRPVLLAQGWPSLYRHPTLPQASQRHLPGNQPNDPTGILLETGRADG